MGKENQYKAIPSSVHLERGYCCDNGCVNCPYKKARELKSAYEKTDDPMVGIQYVDPTDHPKTYAHGCPSHDSFTQEEESKHYIMEVLLNDVLNKAMIGKNRIKGVVSSNKIAEFIINYLNENG